MARTALYAPAHRVAPRLALGNTGGNPDQAPSIDFGGSGIQDPRLPYNTANSATGAAVVGWMETGAIKVISAVPSALATASIAAAAHTTSGTAMTLVSSTGSGITVLASALMVLPSLNTVPAGALAIDGAPGLVTFGTHNRTSFYDPTKALARSVSITGIAGGAGGNFLIKGADIYGYPMSQLLTVAAGANTVNTTKCFKFVYSVTPQFTDGTGTYSIGHGDVYGFGLAADYFSDVDIYWANVIQAAATFTAAVTTSPATTTTGDVRGTFTPGSASDGTKRLDVFVVPSLKRIATAPMSAGLFGVTQV